jgi:hypothetical protein
MNERAEKIREGARKIASCDITIRIGEIEPMLTAGWNAIPIGSVVWADFLHLPDATRIYRKTGADEIAAEQGGKSKVAIVADAQKENLLESYITRYIIGPKK